VKRRDRRPTDYEREEHIQTLERLGRLVVDVPLLAQVDVHRAFVVFMNDYYDCN